MAPKCRLCGSDLTQTFVDLGMSPPCESYLEADQLDRGETFYPLHVRICSSCLLVQLPAYLAGEESGHSPAYTDLGYAIRRTPLAAVAHNGREANRGSALTEGDRLVAGLPIAEIAEDGRLAAAEDLRRFMDERVRVVGGLVLLRTYDPLVKAGPKGWAFQPFPQSREMSYRLADHREPLGYRPDAYEEGLAWEDGRSWNGLPAGIRPWAGSIAGAPYGTDTLRLLAGFAATAALGAFHEIQNTYGYFLFDRVNAAAVELMPGYAAEVWKWAEKACLGRIGVAETEAAVDAAHRLTPPLPLAALVAVPGLYLGGADYLGWPHPELSSPLAAVIYGIAIVGAAFILSWAAEAAQVDINGGLALALLAFLAVLPEYAVDFVFTMRAGLINALVTDAATAHAVLDALAAERA